MNLQKMKDLIKIENDAQNIKIENNDKKVILFMFLTAFALLVWIMWNSPFSSDDFEVASLHLTRLSDIVHYALYYGNGRSLGNFGVVFLANDVVFRSLLKAFMVASIAVLLPYVLDMKRPIDYLASFILMLGASPTLFGQVYIWNAGFANYAPPLFCTLLIIGLIKSHKKGSSVFSTAWKAILILIIGVCSQLFIEISTMMNVLLAGSFLVYALINKNGKRFLSACWLASTTVGLAAMFLIPKIFYIATNRMGKYRSLQIDSIGDLIKSIVSNTLILTNLYLANILFWGLFALVGLAMLNLAKSKWDPKRFRISETVYIVFLLYIIVNYFSSNSTWYGTHALMRFMVSFVFLAAFIANFIYTLLKIESKYVKRLTLFCIAFGFVSVLPLLVVSPVSARVLFQSYVFFAAAILTGISWVLPQLPEYGIRIFKKVAVIGSAVFVLCMGMLFYNVGYLSQVRNDYILQQMEQGADQIDVFRIPYDYIFYDSSWAFGHYYYYHKFEDIDFKTLDIYDWSAKYQFEWRKVIGL